MRASAPTTWWYDARRGGFHIRPCSRSLSASLQTPVQIVAQALRQIRQGIPADGAAAQGHQPAGHGAKQCRVAGGGRQGGVNFPGCAQAVEQFMAFSWRRQSSVQSGSERCWPSPLWQAALRWAWALAKNAGIITKAYHSKSRCFTEKSRKAAAFSFKSGCRCSGQFRAG